MRPRVTATITNPLVAAMGRELFQPSVKNASAWDVARTKAPMWRQDARAAAPSQNPPQSWQDYAKSFAGGWGAPAAGAGVGGLGGYGLGRALGFGQGGSALLGAGGAAAGGYLANRWQGGHFNQLMEPGGMSWGNLGKALWGGDK